MNLQRYYQAEFAEHAAVVERTRLALPSRSPGWLAAACIVCGMAVKSCSSATAAAPPTRSIWRRS